MASYSTIAVGDGAIGAPTAHRPPVNGAGDAMRVERRTGEIARPA